MSVTLEVLKLSGWLNADADCQGRLAVWRRRRRQAACKDIGGTGGAHVEHVRHILDAGGVEAQRLVERPRVLPSRKQGMRCGASCASRKAWKLGRRREAAAGASVARTRRTGDWRAGERTENMAYMVVTLEVSKLSGWLNADAPCRESKGRADGGASCGVSRREAAGDGGARSVQGRV